MTSLRRYSPPSTLAVFITLGYYCPICALISSRGYKSTGTWTSKDKQLQGSFPQHRVLIKNPIPSIMPVSSDYAARTACRDHANICTKELRGSLRFMFYSECEGRRQYGCKFSHTIFNTKRVVRLGGGKQDFHVKLDYGYGFERYGTYEGWSDGWDVTVDGKEYRSHGNMEKTFDIPKALLLAEKRMGLKKAGDPDVPHVKSQSLCMAHYEGAGCQRSDCRYDHDLVDGTRIEKLARWKEQGMSPNFDFLSLECKAKGGVVKWKITMKPDAFKELNATDSFSRTIPPRPFNYESDNLLDVIKQMEQTVGLK